MMVIPSISSPELFSQSVYDPFCQLLCHGNNAEIELYCLKYSIYMYHHRHKATGALLLFQDSFATQIQKWSKIKSLPVSRDFAVKFTTLCVKANSKLLAKYEQVQ